MLKKYEDYGFRIVSVCGWHIMQKSVMLSRFGSIIKYVGIIIVSF